MRAFIVDDEPKVCKLIKGLVNWEELGIELVGEAQNGIAALEEIKKQNVDIVITDIRMPGMDGIQLIQELNKLDRTFAYIVISGYNDFEFVRSALRFGATDYILKPINAKELTDTLKRCAKEQRFFMDNTKARKSFVKNVTEGYNNFTIENVNSEYGFHFREGEFQALVIQADCGDKIAADFLGPIHNRIAAIFDGKLRESCYDFEVASFGSQTVVICNYEPKLHGKMQLSYQEILEELVNLKGEMRLPIELSVGAGVKVKDITALEKSVISAEKAVGKRVLSKTEEVFLANDIDSALDKEKMLADWNTSLEHSVERLDINLVQKSAGEFKTKVMEVNGLKGWELISVVCDAGKRVITLLRNKQMAPDNYKEQLEHYLQRIHMIGSAEKIWEEMFAWLDRLVESAFSSIEDAPSAAVRHGQKFIEDNYMNSITLEEVGEYIGFNASYFSTLFKKETGINFIEYLSSVRIEKAKKLLTDTNHTVAHIAQQVGYSDVKHFNKLFKKYAFLKPNEYRKFYS